MAVFGKLDRTMEQIIQNPFLANFSKLNKKLFWIGIFTLIMGLSVLQDYLFSQIRDTGFYFSDSLLYNCIWIFLVPLTFLETKLLEHVKPWNKGVLIFLMPVISGVLVLLHILIFTSFFVSVSYFVFSPSHRFIRIFNSALSSEFSLLALYYFLTPFLLKSFKTAVQRASSSTMYPENIKVKQGLITISLPTQAIELISTHKPYTLIVANTNSYFDNRTIKDFETVLNPRLFLRVHRSIIVNKNLIRELRSRKNGDYDAFLSNGQTIRLSRHYRTRWKELLQ